MILRVEYESLRVTVLKLYRILEVLKNVRRIVNIKHYNVSHVITILHYQTVPSENKNSKFVFIVHKTISKYCQNEIGH